MPETGPLNRAPFVLRFEDIDLSDVAQVGGKNASLGEMISALAEEGVQVPGGFATTAEAYRAFIEENDLSRELERVVGLFHEGQMTLQEAGATIRELLLGAKLPKRLEEEIAASYSKFCADAGEARPGVAVRTAARLPKTCRRRASPVSRRLS